MKMRALGALAASFVLTGSVQAQVVSSVMTGEAPVEEFVVDPNCYYMQVERTVCGNDGRTYMNAGAAFCGGAMEYTPGACDGSTTVPVVSSEMTTAEFQIVIPEVAEGSLTDYFGDLDSDGDGLSDLVEENLSTDPNNKDTDADGVWDGAEVAMGLSPLSDDLLFSDFDEVDWARDYIINMVTRGSINGFSDGTFRPNENVTRAELLKIMIGALNYDLGAIKPNGEFHDVEDDHWSAPYISFAKGAAVVSGYDDGSFRPNDSITRAEAVKVMTRLVGFPLDVEIEPHFNDISGWQVPYVENARRKGIISTTDDNKFRPDDFITRAEVVKMATKYIENRI